MTQRQALAAAKTTGQAIELQADGTWMLIKSTCPTPWLATRHHISSWADGFAM